MGEQPPAFEIRFPAARCSRHTPEAQTPSSMTPAAGETLEFFLSPRTRWRLQEWGPAPLALPGPVGLCWQNARTFAAADPQRYLYAEGAAWLDGHPQSHGWVVDRAQGSVVELTSGYGEVSRYRGLAFEIAKVIAFVDTPEVRSEWDRELHGEPYSRAPGVVSILFERLHAHELSASEFAAELKRLLAPSTPAASGRNEQRPM